MPNVAIWLNFIGGFVNYIRVCLLICTFVFTSTWANTKSIPKILGSTTEYLPDYSYAGYRFGLHPLPINEGTVLNVTDFGAIPNDGIDDTQAIKLAIKAADVVLGSVIVRFPEGQFIITDIIEISRSNFVLQGAGRGESGTVFYFPRPLNMVDDKGKLTEIRQYLNKYNKRQVTPSKNLDVLYSEYSWTAGFIWVGPKNNRGFAYLNDFNRPLLDDLGVGLVGRRGEKVIAVSDSSQFNIGQRIEVLWYNKQGKNGALIKSIYGDTELDIGSRHWTSPEKPLVKQRTVVTAINDETIIIADTLLHDINDSLPAHIKPWSPIENVGIEDIKFEFPSAAWFGHHVEAGYNGIYFSGVADSWLRNLTFKNADSGVISYDSANVTITDIIFNGDKPGHYAVHLGNVHNFLVQRLHIFTPVVHTFTFNTQATRNVYKDSFAYSAVVLDQHAGANHQNLFDNLTLSIDADKTKEKPSYPLYNGSGAGYWQPGHGRFNTSWNLRLDINSGVPAGQYLHIQGLAEGPDARIIGMSANRQLTIEYFPKPYTEKLNQRIDDIPSLYDYQLSKRKATYQ